MSKSAHIVAQSLLNRHYIHIQLGWFRFRVYQPFIRNLAQTFAIDAPGLHPIDISTSSLRQISQLLFHHSWTQKAFLWYIRKYATYPQIKEAATKIADVVTGKDLFDAVKLDKTKKKTVTETVGNNTIMGMISSIMEHLNITYQEACESINYPTMLLMMIDKCRSLTGGEEKIVKGSGKNMGARRSAAKRRKK